MRIFRLFCTLLIHFYPPRFRSEFAAEMQTVLEDVTRDARQVNPRNRLCILWREGWELLCGAVFEQWHRLRKELDRMKVETPSVRGSWLAAVLSGMPFILFALAKFGLWLSVDITNHLERFFYPMYRFAHHTPAYLGLLKYYGHSNYWRSIDVAYQTVQWVFGVLVIIMLLIGWRGGWPRWAAVWMGFFTVVVADNLISFNPPGILGDGIAVVSWLLLVELVVYWQAKRDALKGFLAVLPVVPMMFWWFSMDSIIGNEAPYYVLIGILMGLGVGAVVRIGTMKVALGLLLPLILLISLGVSYATVYHTNIPLPYEPSVWQVLTGNLIELVFLGIFTSPLWSLYLGRAIRRRMTPA